MNYIVISEFCVAPDGMKYDCLCLFDGVLSSDNSMVCFRRKAFLKSDTVAGLTKSLSLRLCYLRQFITEHTAQFKLRFLDIKRDFMNKSKMYCVTWSPGSATR